MTDHDRSVPEPLEKRLPHKTRPASAFSRFSRLVTYRSVAVAALAALISTGVAFSVDTAPEARADDQSSLAGTSTIEGTVTDEDGVPLSRSELVVGITLYRFVSTGTQLTSTLYNDESGGFSFTGLEPGSYTLCFRVSSWSGNVVRECWEDRPAGASTANRIELEVGQQVTGLRVALEGGTVRLTGPSITGRLAVGSTLSANAFSATPTATLNYTWSRAGTVISGANGPTLELTPADQGHAISVEVEASAPERITVWGESESVNSVRPGSLIWSQPTISGVPVVGHTLTAVPGDWTPGTTFAFEWNVSRTGAVVGNGPTIALTRDFVENYSGLEVTITGSIPGYTPVSATSEPTEWVSRGPAPVSTPTISGTPIVGSTLTASAAAESTDFAVQYEWFADGEPTASDGTRFFVLESWHVGKRISVRADAWGGGYISTTTPRSAETGQVQPIPPVGVVSRIAGQDRYASSVAISRSQFAPGVETVFIASGTDFPDALSGAPLAGHRGGPLLLTTRDDLPAAIVDELKRLRPRTAVVIGGTGAVSRKVESQVRALTAQEVAVRVAGSDRYATSVALSKMEFDGAAAPRVAYIANGAAFADALAGAPLAGREHGPLLLSSTSSLPAVVASELERLKPERIVILGGTGAVSSAVARQLEAYTNGGVTRLAGADRYATSAAISRAGFKPGVPVVYVASGATFPDALSGAPLGTINGGPVLLSPPNSYPSAAIEEIQRLRPNRIVMLGGPGSLSDSVRAEFEILY